MKTWQGMIISVVGHLAVVCALAFAPPVDMHRHRSCIEVQLVSFHPGESRSPEAPEGEGEDRLQDRVLPVDFQDRRPPPAPPHLEERSAPPKPDAKQPGKTTLPQKAKTRPAAISKDNAGGSGSRQAAFSEEAHQETEYARGPPSFTESHGQSPAGDSPSNSIDLPDGGAPEGAEIPGIHSASGDIHGGGVSGRTRKGRSTGDSGLFGPMDARFGTADGPGFIRKANPVYPHLARQLGREGTVLLRVTINEKGHPVHVEIMDRAGSGFDEEAVRAVKESSFKPARRDGRPVSCRVLLPIRFVLKGSG